MRAGRVAPLGAFVVIMQFMALASSVQGSVCRWKLESVLGGVAPPFEQTASQKQWQEWGVGGVLGALKRKQSDWAQGTQGAEVSGEKRQLIASIIRSLETGERLNRKEQKFVWAQIFYPRRSAHERMKAQLSGAPLADFLLSLGDQRDVDGLKAMMRSVQGQYPREGPEQILSRLRRNLRACVVRS